MMSKDKKYFDDDGYEISYKQYQKDREYDKYYNTVSDILSFSYVVSNKNSLFRLKLLNFVTRLYLCWCVRSVKNLNKIER